MRKPYNIAIVQLYAVEFQFATLVSKILVVLYTYHRVDVFFAVMYMFPERRTHNPVTIIVWIVLIVKQNDIAVIQNITVVLLGTQAVLVHLAAENLIWIGHHVDTLLDVDIVTEFRIGFWIHNWISIFINGIVNKRHRAGFIASLFTSDAFGRILLQLVILAVVLITNNTGLVQVLVTMVAISEINIVLSARFSTVGVQSQHARCNRKSSSSVSFGVNIEFNIFRRYDVFLLAIDNNYAQSVGKAFAMNHYGSWLAYTRRQIFDIQDPRVIIVITSRIHIYVDS